MAEPVRLGFATFPPPMLSVPASPHLVGQDLRIEAEEFCDLEAVLTKQDQFAPLPVLPGRAINT